MPLAQRIFHILEKELTPQGFVVELVGNEIKLTDVLHFPHIDYAIKVKEETK